MKIQKKMLLAALMACGTLAASAVPAKRGTWRTLTLADGTQVRAELRGDEFCNYWAADDGSCYTQIDDSELFAKANIGELRQRGNALRTQANIARSRRKAQARIGTPNGSILGKKKGIVILVDFPDMKFGVGYNRAFVDGYVNGPLKKTHTARGFVGTVKDYFLAQSNGQFELDFDVVGPYTLSQSYAYYGKRTGGDYDAHAGIMILEAVRAADKDVNFADYVWSGNGEVDQIYVLYAGHGEADGYDTNTVWPHESSLANSEVGQAYTTDDVDDKGNKVKVDTYACGPELLGTKRAGIGTLCHEFAHCLGYPDMYDTTYSGHYGMGMYDLMDQGSYNGSSFCPPNFTAYEKMFAGWIEPTVLDKAATVKGIHAQDVKYGQTFIVQNDASANEYYLLENRQNNVGLWDTELPASGLMITHVDYDEDVWSINNVNSCINFSDSYGQQFARFDSDHERLTIFCADNDRTESTDNAAGDLYPYNGNNELTDTSSPAAVIYNGGTRMGKPITNITQNADGTVDFDFMGGSSTNVITAIGAIHSIGDKSADKRVFAIDGRSLGNDINAVGKGVFVQGGKKIVR